MLIGGAAINRDFGRRVLYPKGRESDEVYEPGVFYCKDAFSGLDTMDALVDEDAREPARREDPRRGPDAAREAGGRRRLAADDRRLGALGGLRPTTRSPSRPLGASATSRSTSTRSSPTSTATCSSSCTGAGAGSRARPGGGSSRATARTRASRRSSSACGASRTTCARSARIGYFPCNADGNELVVFDPADHDRELERLVFPRQPKHDRICLADFFRPLDRFGRARRRRLQGVTVGPR